MSHRPGTVPPQKTPHPRRPPAHKSVSLRHSPPSSAGFSSKAPILQQHQPTALSSPNAPASDKANPPSSVSPKITSNKHSSGESSDAGKWFENTNNNALQSNASFADSKLRSAQDSHGANMCLADDPPFFLRNSSSSDTPPDGHGLHQQLSTMPYRPGLAHFGTDGSSTEDFRSVIDDLTIANKRLKQRLKKYERLYDAHLQDEKLFEVRFHGLPHHKKKELEETLQKFAAGLDTSPSSDIPTTTHQPPPFDPQKTASSHTSRFAESGYASMSASGQNSISGPSNQASLQMPSHDGDRRMTKSQYNRQQQSIHSYLHDIPAGLLPKSHAPMTEKSKKKLVVRRLEQVFAGKRSTPGNHSQPMQQEEVAQSAAMADRQAREATGQRYKMEGNREARIMPVRADDEDITAAAVTESVQRLRPQLNIGEQDFAGSGSPDQRPTRPLDLDPYRAQVPAENMEYIRHLGFTPPDVVTGDAPENGHGWLYLNLLVNMAQLHTLNVTPDFVKHAVTEYSSKFELSHDGRKIRWKGGHNVTRNSSDSSSEQLSGNSPYDTPPGGNGKSPLKKLKTGHSGSSDSKMDPERKARRLARARREREQNKFAYTPIFHHKDDDSEDDDYIDIGSSSNSLFQGQQPGDSSGFGSSAMRSSSSRKRRDDGPIIFYNKAKFCTDLSGDSRGLAAHNAGVYSNITTRPLGLDSVPLCPVPRYTDFGEPRGPLDASPMEIDPKDGARISSGEDEIGFSPESLKNDNGTDSPETIEFEASGLGGVQPEDNFSIKVCRSQIHTASSDVFVRRKSQLYPKTILEALTEHPSSEAEASSRQQHSIIKEEILSASRKSLPSSTLPPASFLPFDSTSSGDVDSDLESNVSSSPSTTSSSDNGPTTALGTFNVSPMHMGNQAEDSDQEPLEGNQYSDSDESIDLLATARKMDPTTVRASEREFDAAFAERLAEEIPAGSSAATAGGGSGFNSPASVIGAVSTTEEAETSSPRARVKRRSTTSGSISSRSKNLKRTRTRDSLAALQGTKTQKTQKLE